MQQLPIMYNRPHKLQDGIILSLPYASIISNTKHLRIAAILSAHIKANRWSRDKSCRRLKCEIEDKLVLNNYMRQESFSVFIDTQGYIWRRTQLALLLHKIYDIYVLFWLHCY